MRVLNRSEDQLWDEYGEDDGDGAGEPLPEHAPPVPLVLDKQGLSPLVDVPLLCPEVVTFFMFWTKERPQAPS
jgi:hypothetical protein